MKREFDSIERAIEVLKAGGLIIVSDDESRENEGDIVGLAETITPDGLNFMITEARGLVCMPISQEIAKKLELNQMVDNNTESHGTAFTVSIDGEYTKTGVTTGISAFDRAATINKVVEKGATKKDFVQPGHVFPLVAKSRGVLERVGHTEAAVDLAILAGKAAAGVICEIIKPDGNMARQDYLFEMADKFKLPFITIDSLVEYCKLQEEIERNPDNVVIAG